MSIVLDTSILIDLERKAPLTITKLETITTLYPSPAKITVISAFEFQLGIQRKTPKNKDKALSFLNNFVTLHTSDKTAAILANLKFKYDSQGVVVPLADILIAALVIENNMILVTRDKDFEKIEELKKIIF